MGRWYGDASVWATIVSVLAVFELAKGKDAAGNEIGIDPDNYGGGLVRYVCICTMSGRLMTMI